MADQSQSGIRLAPGVASITNVNWPGLRALYVKEVRRFFKVQLQTIWAPAITTMLYLVIFTVAMVNTIRNSNVVIAGAHTVWSCTLKNRRTSFT